MNNRTSVVLSVGGAMADLPLMSDGRTPSTSCWLVQPFTNWSPTKLWFVERVTPHYVFAAECGSGRRRRFDREWLSASSMVLAVSSLLHIVFYGAAVRGGWCAIRISGIGAGRALPSDLVGYSEVVGPDQHRRVWELCPGSSAEGIWPIHDHYVDIRRRGASWHENTYLMTAFDLWLVCCGFVDGCEAVYQGDEI